MNGHCLSLLKKLKRLIASLCSVPSPSSQVLTMCKATLIFFSRYSSRHRTRKRIKREKKRIQIEGRSPFLYTDRQKFQVPQRHTIQDILSHVYMSQPTLNFSWEAISTQSRDIKYTTRIQTPHTRYRLISCHHCLPRFLPFIRCLTTPSKRNSWTRGLVRKWMVTLRQEQIGRDFV
jgi:hypothetical protein